MAYGTLPNIANAGHEPTPDIRAEQIARNLLHFPHGPITVIDAAGNQFPISAEKPSVALCRCGQSKNKPFCDGSHKGCNFLAAERAPLPVNPTPAS